jgi:hypothetical protein
MENEQGKAMADTKRNQPPAAEGKQQSPVRGKSGELDKRSDIAQSSHAAQNLGPEQDEMSRRENPSQRRDNPNRPKAGR